MAKLYAIDASFLAGEVDPAVVARLDDVVRANGAGKLRNVYVRSMGGCRTRPGMRVALSIEGRGFDTLRDLPNVRFFARTFRTNLRTVEDSPVTNTPSLVQGAWIIIAPWSVGLNVDVFRVVFGETIPAGTTISVRMRLSPDAPEGTVQRLWWWERNPGTVANPTFEHWRTGAGHDPTRPTDADLIELVGDAWRTFTHVLVEDSDSIALRPREWTTAGVQASIEGPGPLEVADWGGERTATPGAGRRPPARLLNVTWREGTDLLLVLYGSQSALVQGRDPTSLRLDPFGYDRRTGFEDDDVRTMQAVPTPDGVYLHAPGDGRRFFSGQWPPQRLDIAAVIDPVTGVAGQARIRQIPVKHDNTIPRGSGRVTALGPGFPPTALYAWQGRLIAAGTVPAPNSVWFSKTNDHLEFRAPTITEQRPLLATDAFTVTEVGRPINRIVAIYGGRALVFFGTHGISFMDDAAISATSFGFRENSERGIKAGVPPVEIGTNRLVFVDASGQSVWLMTYANERQGYILSELSQVAPHLLNEPEDAVFHTGLQDGGTAVLIHNADGTIACCAIQPEGEWHAWSQWSSGDGDILDIEPYGGSVWAITRRGNVGKALYIESFDDEVELDFCHVSTDGTHPFAASYERWSAVAEMDDGSHLRFGMTPETDEPPTVVQERHPQTFTSTEVFEGLSNIVDREPLMADDGTELDLSRVVRWQVGQPFEWLVETMPFVKRTAQGSVWQSPTKTQELFVNCIERVGDDFVISEDALGQNVAYTVNGEFLPDTPRLFAQTAGGGVVSRGLRAFSYRHINIFGWRTENAIALKGQQPCILTSISRTVVA